MRALVVYESMYGNTHVVADHIAAGLRSECEVRVVPVTEARAELTDVDLVVAGGPTHAHGMTRASTRKAAREAASDPAKHLHLDDAATGEGLRDWLAALVAPGPMAVAFDTRFRLPAAFTGRAGAAISRQFRRRGLRVITKPASFFVDNENHLLAGEDARAEAWGARVATIARKHAAHRGVSGSHPTSAG